MKNVRKFFAYTVSVRVCVMHVYECSGASSVVHSLCEIAGVHVCECFFVCLSLMCAQSERLVQFLCIRNVSTSIFSYGFDNRTKLSICLDCYMKYSTEIPLWCRVRYGRKNPIWNELNESKCSTIANEVKSERARESRIKSNQKPCTCSSTRCVCIYLYDIANKKTNYSSKMLKYSREIASARVSTMAINVEVNVCFFPISRAPLYFPIRVESSACVSVLFAMN